MRDRITTILTRYGNKIQYVDVVNEALAGSMKSDTEFNWITSVRNKDHMWMKVWECIKVKSIICHTILLTHSKSHVRSDIKI